ncbi:eukaryotic translation initiation factor 2-alpha kinase 1 [Aspergillus udagawae]|nr:eukaryotic translation initiation factor 2-alpha kinase 1 [Aspergillus udagawae]
MSMFRPASELSSSSESQSSSDESDHGLLSTGTSKKTRGKSRSGNGAQAASLDREPGTESISEASMDVLDVEAQGHTAWMTSALLEFYCLSKATDILNAREGSQMRYTRESPEVQHLAKTMYAHQSQLLSTHGILPGGIESDEWGERRQKYRETLDGIGLQALKGLNLDDIPKQTPSLGTTKDVVLASKASNRMQVHVETAFARPSQMRRQYSGLLGFREQGAARDDTHAPDHQPFALLGSSPVSFPLFRPNPPPPTPAISRYATEFSEVRVLGRGSFGEVYHVKNHIDGQNYAIKKIPLSQRRLQQLQGGNQNQLESIMKEIRTLARLEHTNVVRYYGAWVEQAHISDLLHSRDMSAMEFQHEESHSVCLTQESNDEQSFGVVFEHSEVSAVEARSISTSAESEADAPHHSRRRYSHATSASRPLKNSLTRSLEDDEEVESIPRDFNFASHGQLSTFGDTDDDIFTDGLSYDASKLQVQRRRQNRSQLPAVVLHIQMSLHPISLNTYLSPHSLGLAEHKHTPPRRHCFHLIPSLRLMLRIISGVEYLHGKGIIHRDLKPANIFLSPSDNGRLDGCPSCIPNYGSTPDYCHPRIGDFGLVADVSHLNDYPTPSIEEGPKLARVVGTEFYRPPLSTNGEKHSTGMFQTGNHHFSYIVDETLDVYALGVILFELLYRLNTKMERQMVLTDLTKGTNRQSPARTCIRNTVFPADFAQKLDMGSIMLEDGVSVADSLMRCISGMLEPNPHRRLRCADIKRALENILDAAAVQDLSSC